VSEPYREPWAGLFERYGMEGPFDVEDGWRVATILAIAHHEKGFEITPPKGRPADEARWIRDNLMESFLQSGSVSLERAAHLTEKAVSRRTRDGEYNSPGRPVVKGISARSIESDFAARRADGRRVERERIATARKRDFWRLACHVGRREAKRRFRNAAARSFRHLAERVGPAEARQHLSAPSMTWHGEAPPSVRRYLELVAHVERLVSIAPPATRAPMPIGIRIAAPIG